MTYKFIDLIAITLRWKEGLMVMNYSHVKRDRQVRSKVDIPVFPLGELFI